MKPVKFSRSARKHKIGKARALAALENADESTFVPATQERGEQYLWVSQDDRGVELEIVGVDKPDCLLIIHVRPTSYEHQEPS